MNHHADPASAKRHRILLIDDHPVLRQGLSVLINKEHDLLVGGEAENATEALELLDRETFDLAIVDVSLPGVDGIELLKELRSRHRDLSTLVLSMHDELVFAERALRAGAMGFIMKQEAVENVLEAIHRVLSGQIYVSERIATRVLRKLTEGNSQPDRRTLHMLTDREITIFTLIGQGYGTRQIAEQLHLSVKTIESHRAHIKEKLEISTGPELVRYASLWVGGVPQG